MGPTPLWIPSLRRPATQGSLDPSTPYIEVPENVDEHENPGDDLPYYYVTVVENGAAHTPAAVRKLCMLLVPGVA